MEEMGQVVAFSCVQSIVGLENLMLFNAPSHQLKITVFLFLFFHHELFKIIIINKLWKIFLLLIMSQFFIVYAPTNL
jgi:hypothetical protein